MTLKGKYHIGDTPIFQVHPLPTHDGRKGATTQLPLWPQNCTPRSVTYLVLHRVHRAHQTVGLKYGITCSRRATHGTQGEGMEGIASLGTMPDLMERFGLLTQTDRCFFERSWIIDEVLLQWLAETRGVEQARSKRDNKAIYYLLACSSIRRDGSDYILTNYVICM